MTQNTVTIPAELIPELEAWGKLTAKLFGQLRQQTGIPPKGVPKDQEWFWSKKWQAMEHEADQALSNGEYDDFDTVEEPIADLHNHS